MTLIAERPNPHMLVIARESRGKSQSALADEIGVAQGTVSKVESGVLPATRELVAKYASALGYPELFFFRPYQARNLPVTFFRKKQSLGMYETRRITASANIQRIHIDALLKAADVKPKEVPKVDLEADRSTPESTARDLRTAWHIQPGPIPNLTSLLESRGMFIVAYDFESDRVSGLSLYDPHDPLQLPPIIMGNKAFPCDHWRFTLAHELGHVIFHHHLPLPPDAACEPQADRFASEFLLPSAEVKNDLSNLTVRRLIDLKAYWKVSIGTLVRKAFDLKKISESQRKRLYQEFASHGFSRTNEPVQLAPEKPSLLDEVVQFHTRDLNYSAGQLAMAMGMEEWEVERRYLPPVRHLRALK